MKNIKRTNIAMNIITHRKKLNINQTEAAKLLGISRDRYARYETDTVPPVKILLKIAELYNISTDELIKTQDGFYPSKIEKPLPPKTLGTYKGFDKQDQKNNISDEELETILKMRELPPNKLDIILKLLEELQIKSPTI